MYGGTCSAHLNYITANNKRTSKKDTQVEVSGDTFTIKPDKAIIPWYDSIFVLNSQRVIWD